MDTTPIPFAPTDGSFSPSSSYDHFSKKNNTKLFGMVILVVLFMGMAGILLSLQTKQDVRSKAALTGPTLTSLLCPYIKIDGERSRPYS